MGRHDYREGERIILPPTHIKIWSFCYAKFREKGSVKIFSVQGLNLGVLFEISIYILGWELAKKKKKYLDSNE